MSQLDRGDPSTPLSKKSSVEAIRARFEADVERFSQLERGQTATMDAALSLQLISQAALASTHPIRRVLDVGCGAGNYTLKLRQELGSDFDVDLLDLSPKMLARAAQRVGAAVKGSVRLIEADFRQASLQNGSYDVILAGAVFHHLRAEDEWQAAFRKVYRLLAPGGSVWISDLVAHESAAVQEIMWRRYAAYLEELGGPDYRQRVFDYIDKEDSPRPVTFQLDLLRSVGFSRVELLHKQACFAAFGAIKAG
jgi:tRNA (cmo5U34)-methyltransferase